jgi:hypothetical protein
MKSAPSLRGQNSYFLVSCESRSRNASVFVRPLPTRMLTQRKPRCASCTRKYILQRILVKRGAQRRTFFVKSSMGDASTGLGGEIRRCSVLISTTSSGCKVRYIATYIHSTASYVRVNDMYRRQVNTGRHCISEVPVVQYLAL